MMPNSPSPDNMAEHLKELGPEKVAAALCAAFAALTPLCSGGSARPAEPGDIRSVAADASKTFAAKKGGTAWTS